VALAEFGDLLNLTHCLSPTRQVAALPKVRGLRCQLGFVHTLVSRGIVGAAVALDRRALDSAREGMLEGFSLGSYLLLVDYTGRLFRESRRASRASCPAASIG